MVKLGFVGDLYPGPAGSLRLASAVRDRLLGVDLLVGNLEGPITASTVDSAGKSVHLRSEPASMALLTEMGVDVVSLANNHMFDFGVGGYEDTVDLLSKSSIAFVGAGNDLDAARRPLAIDVGGVSIGILAYSSPAIETVCATAKTAGCAPLDRDLIEEDLAALRGSADISVLFLHWGLMGYELPTPAQRGLGLALLDAGATLVIGCHPHVLQGVVARPGVLLAHSLGDFAFYPEKADGKPVDQHRVRQTGALLTVDVDGHGVAAHQLILTRQRGTGIGLETSASRRRSVERRGGAPGAADPRYPALWRRYVLRRTVSRLGHRLAPWNWRTLARGAVKGFGVAVREIFGR